MPDKVTRARSWKSGKRPRQAFTLISGAIGGEFTDLAEALIARLDVHVVDVSGLI